MSKLENYVKNEKEYMRVEYELICKLIKLRNEKGLSQRQLAELADIDQPSIARIESGRHTPSFKMLIKLLDVLGYKIEFIEK